MAAHVEVGVALIVCRSDNKILLQKRKGKHAPGCWGCPGGHLEKWETFEDCAQRELEEEAGKDIKVSFPETWTVTNNAYKNEDKHVATVFMVSRYVSGEAIVMEPEKCEEWRWISWETLQLDHKNRDFMIKLMPGINTLLDRQLSPFDR